MLLWLRAFSLTRHRAPADVTAAKSFRPTDAIDCLIGALLRLRDGCPRRGDTKHAPAIGQHRIAIGFGASVKHLDAFDFGRLIKPLDTRAFGIVAGITPR